MHSFASGYLAVVNSAAMDVCVQVFVCIPVFNSFGYICRYGIAGSHGNSMFSFLRNLLALLHGAVPFLH